MRRSSILTLALALTFTAPGCGGEGDETAAKPTETSLAKTPVERAAMEFAAARELEKRKKKDAVEAYRRIIQDFPDTPQARASAERVQKLGGR